MFNVIRSPLARLETGVKARVMVTVAEAGCGDARPVNEKAATVLPQKTGAAMEPPISAATTTNARKTFDIG